MPMVCKEKILRLHGLRTALRGNASLVSKRNGGCFLSARARTRITARPRTGAEKFPAVASHPQRFAADSEHGRQFLFAVAVLIAFDEFGDIVFDRQRGGERAFRSGWLRQGRGIERREIGKIAHRERRAIGEDDRALYKIFEFTHVARPAIATEKLIHVS